MSNGFGVMREEIEIATGLSVIENHYREMKGKRMVKKVVMLSGIPGCGKSTYAAQHYPDATVCSADHFFIDDDSGEYVFNPAMLPEAHSACLVEFLLNLQRDDGVIVVDNKNLRHWERAPYQSAAKLLGWEVETVFFDVDTIESVKVCSARNIHGVPREVIARMALDHENQVYGANITRIRVGRRV